MNPVLPARLPRHRIDPDAIMVCRRLQEAGHETYLVGGCVRDILLGRSPKDFDVGTLATPAEVRRLFRNCRIIGRRFKLAHVVFGPKIIEVATFRGGGGEDESEDGDHLILRANNFGTPEQDALSRDFTMNALFYDPIAEKILDHVNGYPDVCAGVVRTIGDPRVRFQEDPVRILRAVKFASRLGFDVEPETLAAMEEVAEDILRCPMPRVTEEMYRLMESRHSRAAFEMMLKRGILDVILPELAEFGRENEAELLRVAGVADRLCAAHHSVGRPFLLTAFYYPLALRAVREAGLEPGPGWGQVVEEWFRPIGVRMHIAVKHRLRMRSLVAMMGRIHAADKPRRRIGSHDRRALPQALTLMRLHHRVYGGLEAQYEGYRTLAREHGVPWVPVTMPAVERGEESEAEAPRRRRRRRRRSGRRRGGEGGEKAED